LHICERIREQALLSLGVLGPLSLFSGPYSEDL